MSIVNDDANVGIIYFSIVFGDPFSRKMTARQDGLPYSLAGKTVSMKTATSLLTFAVSSSDWSSGVFNVSLTKEQTTSLVDGEEFFLKWDDVSILAGKILRKKI